MTTSSISADVIAQLTPNLLAAARRSVARQEDAEDLVQETWISALRTHSKFEGRSSLKTWLMSILRRRVADYYRRRKPSEELIETRLPIDSQLGEQLAFREMAELAEGGLEDLSQLERDAVVACDVDGLERDDAVVKLGVSRGHLRVLLHRGRAKLRDHLQTQGVASLDAAA